MHKFISALVTGLGMFFIMYCLYSIAGTAGDNLQLMVYASVNVALGYLLGAAHHEIA